MQAQGLPSFSHVSNPEIHIFMFIQNKIKQNKTKHVREPALALDLPGQSCWWRVEEAQKTVSSGDLVRGAFWQPAQAAWVGTGGGGPRWAGQYGLFTRPQLEASGKPCVAARGPGVDPE